jgi:hypothetical protein
MLNTLSAAASDIDWSLVGEAGLNVAVAVGKAVVAAIFG